MVGADVVYQFEVEDAEVDKAVELGEALATSPPEVG